MPPLSNARGITSYPFFSTVLIGLSIAQLVAMAQIYISNLQLFEDISALHRAGYLEIPTLHSLQRMGTLKPTVFGGLFFTLSTGAGLTLATIGAIWIWHNLSRRNRPVLVLLLIIWVAGLLMVNLNGFNLFGSLYFALIPAGVSLVYLRCLPPEHDHNGVLNRLLPLYPLACLAVIWVIQADNNLFINIRDFLLLSNPVGKSVNDFYYRYTLYPAEAFKSQEQKLQHPIRLTDIRPAALDRRVTSQMRYRDYLVVGDDAPVELQIKQAGDHLDWLNNGLRILAITPESFFSNPNAVLAQYSRQTDRSAFLRTFTFFGILLAFPILLYCGFFGILRLLTGFVLQPSRATLFSSLVCFIIGVLLLVPVYQGGRRPVDAGDLAAALDAADWRNRVAALKLIEQLQLEITAYPSYQKSIASRHLPERYWLAHALGLSKDHRTIDDLFTLLSDPQPNVVCQALYGLGKRGGDRRPEVIAAILATIRSTDSWYVQRYAYLALRSLGWRQPESN
ncbi:MAG: HEAT repeat domain-containing protein [Desulfobacterales bacterium]